ncbi:resistance to lethality of mkk1p386 overexpression [Lithohypha guttulata]|uniref:Resistance to lethality of mkk1p386 overexpression n=1 Tax=Lithohypha guttulata TaxID=1690604 RepID=A0AAN7T4M8_9EURO|nr:resistance to lethality of mkk1p386 overexpression [Lithohypha guttulata]
MGRRKIEIRAIKDDRNRSVTFLKRKGGLFKKAHELSVLCSVDVAVIIFGHNKKLYEFSSGDINETLRRYQYYGPPHEHKGPGDFKNKGGDDDDEDEDDGDDGSQKREDSLPPQPHQQQHLMPPHMQHNSFQHVRQPAASASPPMPNRMFPRHSTPQPAGMISRSNSRQEIRRPTSTMVPLQQAPHPAPPPNGYAYMPNPPIYNPHAAVPVSGPPPHPSPQPQYQHFQQQPQQQPQQQSHQQIQHAHQQFLQDQRRQSQPPSSMPPTSNSLQPPPQPIRRASPQPEHTNLRPPSPPERKHTSSKSQSIFTPIDEGGSVLARVFFGAADPPRRQDQNQSPPEIKPPPRAISQPSSQLLRPAPSQPVRATTTASASREFAAPQRSDTSGSKGAARPKLNLTIPSEAEEDESGSGSPRGAETRSANPERNHNGILLPPPSPSASALLSAGASGPPNPFARPPPPTSQQNSNAYSENKNTIETPVSALPSRYMEQSLIASPGGLFSDWDNWGRGGLNSAVLPSPLTFPTPAESKPPVLFGGKNETGDDKRKAEEVTGGESKRLKT